MKIAVRYFSRSGNTRKLAEAVARGAGAEAKDVREGLAEDVDLLFLGSSVYAAGVDDEIKKFIGGLEVRVGQVVNFSTAAILRSTAKQVGKLLEDKGIRLSEREFYCKGAFGPLHKGKPDAADLRRAEEFARQIAAGA